MKLMKSVAKIVKRRWCIACPPHVSLQLQAAGYGNFCRECYWRLAVVRQDHSDKSELPEVEGHEERIQRYTDMIARGERLFESTPE